MFVYMESSQTDMLGQKERGRNAEERLVGRGGGGEKAERWRILGGEREDGWKE